ncbi:MAG: hypothetical protein QXR96_02345 [Candidatus Woesearchaeota archaeon]
MTVDIQKIKIYRDKKFIETYISETTKPLILVGSGNSIYKPSTHIGENISQALLDAKIDFVRTWSEWPKDDWVYNNGVYAPNQERRINEKPYYAIWEGGNYVFGNDFCLVSQGQVYNLNDQESVFSFQEELKNAFGLKSVYIMPYKGHKHIDLVIGYVPWKNLFVVDESYFRENQELLERILSDLNSYLILSSENLAPNFFVYDYCFYGEERFVVTYASPTLSKRLERRGIFVIQPRNASVEHLRYMGGASCCMNKIHNLGLLNQIVEENEGKRVYMKNPHI